MVRLLSDNPVFRRESRRWLRGRWLRRGRSAGIAAAIAFLFVWFYLRVLLAMGDADVTNFKSLWFWVTHGLLVLIVLLGPLLASASIIKEREQRTWESLALTRLLGREIILGKWLAAMLPVCLLIVAAMPLMLMLCASLGTSVWVVIFVVIFYLVTAAAYTLLGLLCSFLARKASVARMSSLFVAFGICFGLLIIDMVFRNLVMPGVRSYSPMEPLFSRDFGYRGNYDYGYFGCPAMSWFSPFYVLSVLSDWAQARNTFYDASSFDGNDVWSAQPSSVLLVYSLSLVLAVAFCWYYMLTRYRRDVRGGKPLGETIA